MKSLENTRYIPERFCGGDSLRKGAISSVCTFTFALQSRIRRVSTLSAVDKVERVEFDFVASVLVLGVSRTGDAKSPQNAAWFWQKVTRFIRSVDLYLCVYVSRIMKTVVDVFR